MTKSKTFYETSKRQKMVNAIRWAWGLSSKHRKPIILFIGRTYLIFIPFEAYAEAAANARPPQSKSEKLAMFAKFAVGITTCMDPSALPIQKVVACIKPCCPAVVCS